MSIGMRMAVAMLESTATASTVSTKTSTDPGALHSAQPAIQEWDRRFIPCTRLHVRR